MRVVISGQKQFGADVFRICRKLGHDIACVWCPTTNTSGDGLDRLAAVAKTFGVPVRESGTLSKDTLPEGVELVVAAHSHDFIGRATRMACKYGAVGYHPSLLPRHRGRDAVRWAIKMGDHVTGGSIYWLNEVMDGGPIAAQEWCWIRRDDTAETLWRRELFPIGLKLMNQVLADIPSYFLNKEPQRTDVATFEPAINQPRAFRPDLLALTHKPL